MPLKGTVPEYYRAKAFLLDGETNAPLCQAFEIRRAECEGHQLQHGYDEDTSAAKQKETAVEGGITMGRLLEKYLKKGYDFVIVTSAGNGETANKDAKYSSCFSAIEEKDYPNAYARVIVVGASYAPNTSGTYHFVSTHNYGTRIDVTAPGMDILSCICQNETVGEGKYNSFYGLASGTSMASPHVAGAAALLYEADRTLSGAKVKQILLSTADIPVYGEDSAGNPAKNMINAARAVAQVLGVEYQISSTDGSGNAWTFRDGVLTITGSKPIAPLSQNGISYYPWCLLKDEIISVDIGEGITAIGANAFDCLLNLEEVTLPETLTEIGDYAFNGCPKLAYLAVPPSVISIGECAIGYDGVQLPVFILYGYLAPSAAQQYALDNDVAFVDLSEGIAWRLNQETGELTIIGFGPMDSYVKGSSPWYDSRHEIRTVTIRRGITSVGSYAFCSGSGDSVYDSLTAVTLPDTVTSIDQYAFYKCTALETVHFGSGLTTIGDYAFQGCTGLTEIHLPDSVTSLGSSAFTGCSGLEQITLSGTLTTIGHYAFSGCTGLKQVTLPDTLTYIRSYAFKDCTSLEQVTLPETLTSIGSYAFQGCTSLTEITLPDGVTNLFGTFKDCTGLTRVTLPKAVTDLNYTFQNCTALTAITLPDGVTNLSGAFCGCTALKEITLPDSVTSVGQYAFKGCSALKKINLPDSVTSLGQYAFIDCTSLAVVDVGTGLTAIGQYTFQNCTSLAAILLPDGMTKIGQYAFDGCTSLEQVRLGTSLTSLGAYAFQKCGITAVPVLPETLTSIGSNAFYNCSAMAGSLILPNSLTSLGYWAFYGCAGLTSLSVGSGLSDIPGKAFADCTGLTQVSFKDGLVSISSSAFTGCTGLISLTLPGTVTTVTGFSGCTGLKEVYLPDSVTTIGKSAFYDCDGLVAVTLGTGLTSIGDKAFYSCSALQQVFYRGSAEAWSQITIGSSNTPLTDADRTYDYTG